MRETAYMHGHIILEIYINHKKINYKQSINAKKWLIYRFFYSMHCSSYVTTECFYLHPINYLRLLKINFHAI